MLPSFIIYFSSFEILNPSFIISFKVSTEEFLSYTFSSSGNSSYNQARMLFQYIIPLFAIRPTLFYSGFRPDLMNILSHFFYQIFQLLRELDLFCVHRIRNILFHLTNLLQKSDTRKKVVKELNYRNKAYLCVL